MRRNSYLAVTAFTHADKTGFNASNQSARTEKNLLPSTGMDDSAFVQKRSAFEADHIALMYPGTCTFDFGNDLDTGYHNVANRAK